MTLKEKFETTMLSFLIDKNQDSTMLDHFDKLADEFAIGLLEFIEGTYSYSNIFDYWYLHADTSKTYTKKQLLEIYKKEKQL